MTRALLMAAMLLGAAGGVGAQDLPLDLPQGAGPRGTSGEVRDDGVGYASIDRDGDDRQVAVLHRTLPPGSFVEITALDSGRTIAAMVAGPYAGRDLVAVSPAAAQALDIADGAAVRVRSVTPTAQEQAALRNGQLAGTRLGAPPALLAALRRKLPLAAPASRRATLPPVRAERPHRPAPRPVQSEPEPDEAFAPPPPRAARGHPPPAPAERLRRPAPRPVQSEPEPDEAFAPPPQRAARAAPPPPARAARGRYGVQVAALSSPERAAALARALSGRVVPAGRLYRVQLGPFADAASAVRARANAAHAGYGDARVFPY